MKKITTLLICVVFTISTFAQEKKEQKKLIQQKTCGCEDFVGYVFTYKDKFNKDKWKYWYVLKFNGILNEDCGVKYLTANKNSKFEFPQYPSKTELKKGESEYVIYDNGFYYGEYKDKHKVFSYPINQKIDWAYHSKTKYENLNWKETKDKQIKKKM